MRLIIDENIPYIRSQAERLGECIYLPGAAITPEVARQADVLIVRTRTRIDRSLLEGSRVQLVVTATIGHDHLDTHYLEQAGIAWHNCPGCNATSVAQYVRAALWWASIKGLLSPHFALGSREAAPTVGVVGCGHVGTAVSTALEAEGCRILRCDPPKGEPHHWEQLAEEADVITLHTPLTLEGQHATHHWANTAFFDRLRRKPLFLNTARGECADTAALLRALDLGQISAAIIDTWEHEPHISPQLLQSAFLATPHIAGYSADGKATATRMALEAVAQHFGLPLTFDIQPPAQLVDFNYWTEMEQHRLACSPRVFQHLQRYHPQADCLRLRQNPTAFEAQRSHYPLRRE